MTTENKRYKHAQRNTEAAVAAALKAREIMPAADSKRWVGSLEDATVLREGGYSVRYAERYSTLADLITHASSNNTVFVISTTITLTANTVIPSNVHLEFKQGGSIALAGFTLTINGTFSAPEIAVFSGSGTITCSTMSVLNVKWFGAVGDGSTDDTTAFQRAFTCITTNGGTVVIPPTANYYIIDGEIGLDTGTTAVTVEGNGAKIKQGVTASAYNMFRFRSNMIIKNVELEGYIASGTGGSALPANSYGFRAKDSGGSCDNVIFINCKSHTHSFDGWYVRDANSGGSVRLINCIGYDNQRNDFASVECLSVVIDGGEWGNDTLGTTKTNASIDIEPGNGEFVYQAELKNLVCYHIISISAPLVGYTIYKGYLNNVIFDGSVYDQGSEYYSRCGYQVSNIEHFIIGNIKYLNNAEMKEVNSVHYDPANWSPTPGLRRGLAGRFVNLQREIQQAPNLLPYTTARKAGWTATTSGSGSIADDATIADRLGIRIQNTSGGYAYLKYSITGGYLLTLKSAGYTSAIAGDIGKTVVGGTSGANGTLTAYDNVTRVWTVTSTNYIAFQDDEAITITTGTGAGDLDSSSLNNTWGNDKQFSFGCMVQSFIYNPDYDAGMWVVLNGALNEAGNLQTEEYLLKPTSTNKIEHVNGTFKIPDGTVGIDIYIGSPAADYTYDLIFADVYFCRGLVDNESVAPWSVPVKTTLPATFDEELNANDDILLASGKTIGQTNGGGLSFDSSDDATFDGSILVRGASSKSYGVRVDIDLTLIGGATQGQLMDIAATGLQSITTEDNTITYSNIATLYLQEPNISKGASDTITNASVLYIQEPPTEGANNYAIFVDSGVSRFDGDIHAESGIIRLLETTTPSADTNYGKIYTKTDNVMYFQDGAGTEHTQADSTGTTGGTGSAGAGNQYVELRIGGSTYKVLHDGTV